ncbi:hypothetical protein Acr_10g0004680 [Actinidia rufa]|uniref:Uncharacterized protein n=1 Tax=Actinidia rufa TaxID=165716 RepID=A0A7J0F900_9ERIC|nr:hypothetical protein Acr_10g0004680 [Actinidia rufa]
MEGSPPLETNSLVAIHPSVEEKTNIMTLEELDALREAYSFPPRVRVKLPEEGETITSTRPSETQLVPNAWKSIVCSMAMWRVFKYTLFLFEFRNLFSLNSNPKPDQGWLYFKARNKKALLGGYPSNVLGGLILSCFSDKYCNNPPRLYGDKPKVFEEIFKSVEKIGRFSIPVLLESKLFRRVFVSPGSMASGTAGENRPSGEVPSSSGDVGGIEEDLASHPRPDPFKVIGGKVFNLIFNRNPSSSSNPTSESCSDSSQLVELDSNAMSKRISFKKLREKLEKSKNKSSSGISAPPKGQEEGDLSDQCSDHPTHGLVASWGSTSATLGAALGPTASILGSPSVAKKLLRGVIPSADKEKVEKLTLDQMATKLFHVISQALVLGSSFAIWSREAGEQASLKEGRAVFMEIEVARLQKLSADLEQQLAEARIREQ